MEKGENKRKIKEKKGIRTWNSAQLTFNTARPTYLHAARGRSLLRGPAGQPPSAYHRVCSLFGCVAGPTCQPRLQQPCRPWRKRPWNSELHCLKLAHQSRTALTAPGMHKELVRLLNPLAPSSSRLLFRVHKIFSPPWGSRGRRLGTSASYRPRPLSFAL